MKSIFLKTLEDFNFQKSFRFSRFFYNTFIYSFTHCTKILNSTIVAQGACITYIHNSKNKYIQFSYQL